MVSVKPTWNRKHFVSNKIICYNREDTLILYYFEGLSVFLFCGDKSAFCGATGTLCFGLRLTLPMGFKAQGGCTITCSICCLCIMDSQSQLWIPRPGPGPNFTPLYGEATARETAQWHFWDGRQIRTMT